MIENLEKENLEDVQEGGKEVWCDEELKVNEAKLIEKKDQLKKLKEEIKT